MKKGIFITFEGGEACGKSTQIRLLKEFIDKELNQNDFLFVREPGGTKIGEKLRELILNFEDEKPEPMTELLMFYASRYQNVKQNILPALEKGKIVIADRFYDSTLAYQGGARKIMDINELYKFNRLIIGDLSPDLTFYFKLPPEEAFKRKTKDIVLDRIEKEGIEFHREVAKGYDFIASLEPNRFVTIDASLSPEKIFEIVKENLLKKIEINKNN